MDQELRDAIQKLGEITNEFHSLADRVGNLEKKQGHVPEDINDQLTRVNDALSAQDEIKNRLDQMELAGTRPGSTEQDTAQNEYHNEYVRTFMRRGDERAFTSFVQNSLATDVDADGGFAVPEQIDQRIDRVVTEISPMMSIVDTQRVSTPDYRRLISLGGAASGWVGETGSRTETGTPTLHEVTFPVGEIYANPAITQNALDDMMFDAASWLGDEVGVEFGSKIGKALIDGTGINQPTGLLGGPTPVSTADSGRAMGTLQFVATGVDGDFPASTPQDILLDLVYELKNAYRARGRWLMNRSLLKEIRQFKDTNENYIWQPGLQQGQPSLIAGFPVTEAEDMPDKASNSLSIAFGDFRRAYTAVLRTGTRSLRDPYTNKPYVHFYTTRRVGGNLTNTEAVKLLKFSL